MNRDEIEDYLVGKGLEYPRITKAHIDKLAGCAKVHFHRFEGTTVTVCLLELANGFTTLGESACVDKRNFDEDLGRRMAYDRARDQLWKLEGYLLADRLWSRGD